MLETVGYIRWFGESILGVAENEHYDTLSNTLSLRSEQRPSDFLTVPRDGNVIQNYAGGGYYFLFSKASKRSGEVALFTDELFGNEEQSWSSFAEFLNYKIE